jgi:dihydrofolate reductase
MPYSIVAAIAKNGVIGKDNKLPWDIPEDLAYFYKLVSGKPVVMGHKTYESIGGPIINAKKNVVLSRDRLLQLPRCMVVHSISDVLALYRNSIEEVMIIGGASIYEQFLPFANKMYLTFISNDISGDVYFPKWQPEEWLVTDKRNSQFGEYSYSFAVLARNKY